MSKKRSIKVYGQSGYKYRETPTIMLKDTERAAVKAAEAEFMNREMKALQKRYEAEKVKIRAQMVAEPGARW